MPKRDDAMCGVAKVASYATIALLMSGLVTPLTYTESDGLRSPSPDLMAALQGDSRELRVSNEFAVNLNNSYRLVIPDRCGESGEMELVRLAETEKFEESYVYVPSNCLWLEAGHSETAKSVRLDTQLVEDLLSVFPSLVIYHIHAGTPAEVMDYLPAYTDMVGLVIMNGDYIRDPKIAISHRVITSQGMIEYALVVSEEIEMLLQKLVQAGLGDFIGQNLAYEFSRSVHKLDYYAAVQECDRTTGGSPERLSDCFPMVTSDFVLQHKTIASYVVSGGAK
jgi:hypothetical protein